MNHDDKLIQQLTPLRKELTQLAQELGDGLRHEPSAWANFVRAWNASQQDGSLANDAYRTILERTGQWLATLEEYGRSFDREMRDFAQACQQDLRLKGVRLFAAPLDAVAGRLERGVVGLADEIEERMPGEVRRQRAGAICITWRQPNSWLEGTCVWIDAPFTSLELQPTARRALRQFAELSSPVSDVCADNLLHGLRKGRPALPGFTFSQRNDDRSEMIWKPAAVRAHEKPAKFDPHRLLSAPPTTGDMRDVWKRHADAAKALETVLQTASTPPRDSRELDARREAFAAGAERVVRALAELTGRPAMEMALLVLSLLEQRYDAECSEGPCRGYAAAVEHLQARFSRP